MVSLLANVHVFLLLINFLPSIGKKSYEIIENKDIMYDNDIIGCMNKIAYIICTFTYFY